MPQLLLDDRVVGFFPPGFEQRCSIFFLLLKFSLDRTAKTLGTFHRGLGHAGLDRPYGQIKVGLAVRERLDIKTKPGQSLGDTLKVFRLRRIGFAGETAYVLTARTKHVAGAGFTQNGQGAQHLAYGFVEGREICALGDIAEKSVQRLLYGAQVRLNFGHHLVHGEPLLRTTRHFIQ